MNSGRLRHRISIMSESNVTTDWGEQNLTWAEFAPFWADIRNVREDEVIQSDKVTAKATHVVKVRYKSGILPEMRVDWGTRTFQILGIRADRTDAKFQLLMCEENAD